MAPPMKPVAASTKIEFDNSFVNESLARIFGANEAVVGTPEFCCESARAPHDGQNAFPADRFAPQLVQKWFTTKPAAVLRL